MGKLEDILKGFEPTLTEDYTPSSVSCAFNTGAAGTGKTYNEKKRIQENPTYGILCATTGIAAINLGATTLNSVLKFFDTDSLRDRFNRGGLTSTLHRIGRKVKKLVIDEVSMMDARQLDYIYQAMFQVNEFQDMANAPMGIVLTGDFAQLPPIKAPWAFEADCWEHFERNTNTLTKVWRQDNPEFLEAVNAARSGRGTKCAEILKAIGVKFIPQQEARFKGTTIMSKNDQVDNFNFSALMDVPGDAFGLKTMTWGEQAGEWKNIPETLKLKENAYVMILSNDVSGSFLYANGDCGTIQQKDIDGTIWVKLARNEQVVPIRPIIRYRAMRGDDAEKSLIKTFGGVAKDYEYDKMEHVWCDGDCGLDMPGKRDGQWGKPSYNCPSGSFNVGAIKYYPLRLAYATTVHKSQGLTLDKCQIDCRDHFFGNPGMAYVALSRCRTPEGLVVVGTPEKLAERVKIEPKVKRWL
jgi:ATP-dependent DNA helicase PIF1